MNLLCRTFGALACALILVSATGAKAEPPKVLSVAATDVGAYRYAELTAQAEAIDDKFGTKLRVIPLGNAVARAIALRSGKVEFWQSCSAYYTAFEGAGDFAAKKWGPQPLRMLLLANRDTNFSPATRADSDIETLADIKGTRVAWVVGNSGINIQTKAYLAGAGLTVKDVKLVEFPGYSASVRGLISDQADVVLAANTSPVTLEVASSAAGLKWIEIPHDKKEVWAKIEENAPFVSPSTIRSGGGVEKGQSYQLGGYPCPSYLTQTSQDADKVYWFTKLLVESWDGYKGAIKSAPFWKIDNAIKSHFAVPYHEGAVRYFKEIDVWSDELQSRQDRLIKRGKVLAEAFTEAKANFKGDDKKFPAFWEKKRAEALASAGL